MSKSWFIWTQDFDYEKEFYDIKLEDGTIVEHCWPNAGKLCYSGIKGPTSLPESIPYGEHFDPTGMTVRVSLTDPQSYRVS
jgi:hypothetical protein